MKQTSFILLLMLIALPTMAKVVLPTPISDGMVLQRGQNVKIWGTADPKEKVRVTFLDKKYDGRADENGKWAITLPPLSPGGPFEMKINDITISDILVGDVLLCSGQSNMELPVRRVMDMFAEEIGRDENTNIRHLNVPMSYDFHGPASDVRKTEWKKMVKGGVSEFSALGYFVAKELYAQTGVPVGIIRCAVGGSPVEAWISEEALAPFQKLTAQLRMCQDDEWMEVARRSDFIRSRVWSATLASLTPDSSIPWREMSLFSAKWAFDGQNPIYGTHYFRKKITLSPSQTAEDAILRLGCIVNADSVFVNGTFVGNTTYQYPPRIYKVPKGILKAGENQIDIHLYSYAGGIACFVPDKPYKLITSDGEISLLTGWEYHPGVRMPPMPDSKFFQYEPAGLYNGMIAPMKNYGFSGVLWYQGESNVGRSNEYEVLLSTMIQDWRTAMDAPSLPFYIIELAGFINAQDAGAQRDWNALRASQKAVTQKVPDTYLIENADLGEWNDIHPLDKKTPARRIVDKIINKNNN